MPEQPLYYPAPLPQGPIEEGQVILRDGSTALLRPTRPEDKELLVDFLSQVSQQTRVRRFFGEVSPEQGAAHMLAANDPERRMALVVLTGGGGEPRIIAHGEYVRGAKGDGGDEASADSAEVAFLVDDRYQGKGLGTLLLERLALIAVRQGIRRFYGPTEASNLQMREVFRSSGFPLEEDRDGNYVDFSFSIVPSRESVAQAELRERVATVASLQPFFRPRGVAVVGASRDPESIGYRILEYLVLNRFNGPVYPVNPKARVIGSMPAYARVQDIPEPIDLAVVTVPRDAVAGVIEACGEKGVRALVIITAGFGETGEEGRALQRQLVAQARGYGMRMVGPNCLGLLNSAPDVRLNASFSPVFPQHGPIAMASQSGALGLAVLAYAEQLHLGLSSFVSLGNTADVSGNDLIQYWEDDPDTGVILLYLEAFGNPRRFARLARRIGRKKPILVVKAGRSDAGSRAASSHTAALVASETAVEALFHQAGIIRADTLEQMFDTAALLAGQGLPEGPRVTVVTNAGGPAILAVDALVAEGLEVPESSAALKAQLREGLPPAASLNNPIDMIASAGAAHYRQTVEAVLADPNCDACLILFIPVGLADTEGVAAAIRDAVRSAREAGNHKPVLTCFMNTQGLGEALALEHEAIPSYRFPEAAARALGKSYRYAAWRRQPPGVIPDHPDLQLSQAREVCSEVAEAGGGWLTAEQVELVLRAVGATTVPSEVTATPDEAAAAAERLGYPVALKLLSSTIIHKSDWAGVKLNLRDEADVRAACEDIRQRLQEAGRLEELDGFLLQPMIGDGVELMVGVSDDPLFGPLIAFGLGGVHVEVLKDVVFRITPLTERDAEEMVTGIRGYRLLTGYRGAPEADTAALQDLLLRISRLVEEVPEIAELDLNPVRAHAPGQGYSILDARIRCRPERAAQRENESSSR